VVHFEWIVLVLTKLVKSVKCHTLPSLRRDMDNKNCYSLIDWYLIVGGDHYRGAHERRERRRAPRWRGSGRHVLGGCLQPLYMLQACVAAPERVHPCCRRWGCCGRCRCGCRPACVVVCRQRASAPWCFARGAVSPLHWTGCRTIL
jgi:hypothetical protein